MTRKFEKLPVVIEAVQYDGTNLMDIVDFVDQALLREAFGNVYIVTLEGEMEVSLDDWVIKGVKGEFYPCKPDVFEATYKEVPTDCLGNPCPDHNPVQHRDMRPPWCKKCGNP